jgi:HAD superfamily hydrolase (TIGR01509 family)
MLPSGHVPDEQGGAMKRQAITFDFHNTLVQCDEWFDLEVHHLPSAFVRWYDSRHGCLITADGIGELDLAYRRLRTAIIEHGEELTAERSLAVVFSEFGIKVDDETIARGVHELMDRTLEHASAIMGAVETVRSLAERGIALGVVSSAVYHPFLEWALDKLEIRNHFDVIVTSAGSGFYKSRPEIYRAALSALNADPESSVHVGDSARFDVDGASRAGMRTVWLDHGSAHQPISKPDLTITSLSGVAPRLGQLLAALV